MIRRLLSQHDDSLTHGMSIWHSLGGDSDADTDTPPEGETDDPLPDAVSVCVMTHEAKSVEVVYTRTEFAVSAYDPQIFRLER